MQTSAPSFARLLRQSESEHVRRLGADCSERRGTTLMDHETRADAGHPRDQEQLALLCTGLSAAMVPLPSYRRSI